MVGSADTTKRFIYSFIHTSIVCIVVSFFLFWYLRVSTSCKVAIHFPIRVLERTVRDVAFCFFLLLVSRIRQHPFSPLFFFSLPPLVGQNHPLYTGTVAPRRTRPFCFSIFVLPSRPASRRQFACPQSRVLPRLICIFLLFPSFSVQRLFSDFSNRSIHCRVVMRPCTTEGVRSRRGKKVKCVFTTKQHVSLLCDGRSFVYFFCYLFLCDCFVSS